MKKLVGLALSTLLASSAYADTCSSTLTGVFTNYQASKICKTFGAGTVPLSNNTYLKSFNATSSAFDSLLKADASENTVLNAPTGKLFDFRINDTSKLTFDGTNMLPVTTDVAKLGSSSARFSQAFSNDYRATNGTVLGTYQASGSGSLIFGTTSNHGVDLYTNNVRTWSLSTSGSLSQDSTNGGPIVFNKAGSSLQYKTGGAAATAGTGVCNGTTNVSVSTTAIATTSVVLFSLNTVGGTVGQLPHVTTITAGTSFTFACTASDTSTYNYVIIQTA